MERTEIEASKKGQAAVSFFYSLPEDVDEAVQHYGKDVVFRQFRRQSITDLQQKARSYHAKGILGEQLQTAMDAVKLGEKAERVKRVVVERKMSIEEAVMAGSDVERRAYAESMLERIPVEDRERMRPFFYDWAKVSVSPSNETSNDGSNVSENGVESSSEVDTSTSESSESPVGLAKKPRRTV